MSDDADALAGQAFYRAVASPARPGWYSYIQLFNPVGSGVNVLLDAAWVAGGQPVASEYGIMHYATPFDVPALAGVVLDVAAVPIISTHYGNPNAQCRLLLGTYAGMLATRVDYFWHAAPISAQPQFEKFPYPIVFGPGDGIVLCNFTPSCEGTAGLWLREKPFV